MDMQHNVHVLHTEELERMADELISLMLSLCEEEIRDTSAVPDARISSLAHAAMAAQNAIQTFMAVERIR
jgi:hypothetical protein